MNAQMQDTKREPTKTTGQPRPGQYSLAMEPQVEFKKVKHPLSDEACKNKAEQEEAHRCWKLLKSGKPWFFSDREKKLLKKYYDTIVD